MHARVSTICGIAIISGVIVSAIASIIGVQGHVRAQMDRRKRSSAFFRGGRQSFFKSHPPPESARSHSPSRQRLLPLASPTFFFLSSLSLSLSLSLYFFAIFVFFSIFLFYLFLRSSWCRCRSIVSQFRREKRARWIYGGALCAVLYHETFHATSTNDLWVLLPTLGQLRLKNIDGRRPSDRKGTMRVLNFWVV